MSNLCPKCFHQYNHAGSCPNCGYDATADLGKYPLSLPAGSILNGHYIVGRVLGEGGFGITYSALDYEQKKLVAIKEHFPSAIVTRTERSHVSLISENMLEAFEEGKEKFLDEAKTISQFNGLDSICDIYRYFEENGTAYFSMEYVNGIPLDDYIKKLGRLPTFEETTRLLLPVMEALSHVHDKGIIHRDIAPDNIMVTEDGKVMLIDFGAARYSMGEKSRSLDVILKHGFAPREQYNRHGRQGAYTDVYAMAATYYYAITGKVPQDALDRLEGDHVEPPSKLGVKMPRRAEQALMKALAVNQAQRWQTMREFYEALKKELPPDKAELEEKRKSKTNPTKSKPKRLYAIIAAIAALAIGVGAFFAMGGMEAKTVSPVLDKSSVVASGKAGDNINWVLDKSGTMYISGKGKMDDFKSGELPWSSVKSDICSIIIEDGISCIGDYAFSRHNNLKTISMPSSVVSIGKHAFSYCSALDDITIPDGVTSIEAYTFLVATP